MTTTSSFVSTLATLAASLLWNSSVLMAASSVVGDEVVSRHLRFDQVGACASERVTAISECDSQTILSGLRFACTSGLCHRSNRSNRHNRPMHFSVGPLFARRTYYSILRSANRYRTILTFGVVTPVSLPRNQKLTSFRPASKRRNHRRSARLHQ